MRDAKKPPREIKEEDYLEKKKINKDEEFLNTKEREEKYFKDYELY